MHFNKVLGISTLVVVIIVCASAKQTPSTTSSTTNRTFYASARVWNSRNPNIQPFKENFLLPNNAKLITGTPQNLFNELIKLQFSNITSLILRVGGESYSSSSFNLTPILNFPALDELWVFGNPNKKYDVIAHDVSVASPLRRLHFHLHVNASALLMNFVKYFNSLELLDMKETYIKDDPGILFKISSYLSNLPLSALAINKFFNPVIASHLDHLQLNNTFFPLQNTKVQFLDLRYNRITSISQGCLPILQHLVILDISFNMIYFIERSIAFEILSLHPNIEMLIAEGQGTQQELIPIIVQLNNLSQSTTIKREYVLRNYKQEKLYRRDTKQKKQDKSVFLNANPANLPQRDQNVEQYVYRRDIKGGDGAECLNQHKLNDILTSRDIFCSVVKCLLDASDLPCEYLPSAIELINTKCTFNALIPVSSKLQELYLGEIRTVDYIKLDSESPMINMCFKPNKLRVIDTSFQKELYIETKLTIEGLKTVEELNLEYILVNARAPVLSDICKAFSGVKELNLARNMLRLSKNLTLCDTMQHLQVLNLSYNELLDIPGHMFDECKELKRLDLSNNALVTVPSETRAFLKTLHHRVVLDIINNPLTCNCHQPSIDSILWIKDANRVKIFGKETLLCIKDYRRQLVNAISVEDYKKRCNAKGAVYKAVVATAFLCTSCFVILSATVLIYKYRYRVRTILYRIPYCLCRLHKRNRERAYIFDIFLSYCSEDGAWVRDKLLSILENKHGLGCCVHERDFPICGFIAEEIVKYMEASCVLLVVLSSHSVKKRWPLYEIELADQLDLTTWRRVVYINLNDLRPDPSLPRRVNRILQSRIYLEWPCCEAGQAEAESKFFYKLVATIYSNMTIWPWKRGTIRRKLRERVGYRYIETHTNQLTED